MNPGENITIIMLFVLRMTMKTKMVINNTMHDNDS